MYSVSDTDSETGKREQWNSMLGEQEKLSLRKINKDEFVRIIHVWIVEFNVFLLNEEVKYTSIKWAMQ